MRFPSGKHLESQCPFNRTIVELKLELLGEGDHSMHNQAFNRTIVELKPVV